VQFAKSLAFPYVLVCAIQPLIFNVPRALEGADYSFYDTVTLWRRFYSRHYRDTAVGDISERACSSLSGPDIRGTNGAALSWEFNG
jgi:hypothetical protein